MHELFCLKLILSCPLPAPTSSDKLYSGHSADSLFALVSPSDPPHGLAHLGCINMSIYVQDIESGNLAEAIFKQWFGKNLSHSYPNSWKVSLLVKFNLIRDSNQILI